MRPGPIPNPEVKPVVAAVLLTCVSGWKAAVLASYLASELDQCFHLWILTYYTNPAFEIMLILAVLEDNRMKAYIHIKNQNS